MRTTSQTSSPLAADVIFEGDIIRLEVKVPGFEHAVLDVEASGHRITVSGRRPFSDTGHYLPMERGWAFRRSFNLPHETDMKNLHARVRDGVLTISAPFGAGRAAPNGTPIEVQPSIFACHPDAAAI